MKKDLAFFAALCGLTAAAFAATPDDGSVLSFGGSQPLKTNARVIAASNRDLQQAVHEGRFRSDLYHRLSVFPIHLPPLRERREDIPLAAYLVMRKAARMGRKIERIPNKIVERLMDYAWPENVRELENVWSAQSSFLPARRSVRRGFCIAHFLCFQDCSRIPPHCPNLLVHHNLVSVLVSVRCELTGKAAMVCSPCKTSSRRRARWFG